MARTYARVLQSIAPVDLIVFLGDLIDEGSTATREEYASTVRRFERIFTKPTGAGVRVGCMCMRINMQRIYLPGDNDIGGEGSEPVRAHAVERFENTFVSDYDLTQHDLVRRLNLSLFVVDVFQQTATCLPMSSKRAGECTMSTTNASSSLRVVLTHAPAMQANTLCYRLVQYVNGGLILSAHDHQVRVCMNARCSPHMNAGARDHPPTATWRR